MTVCQCTQIKPTQPPAAAHPSDLVGVGFSCRYHPKAQKAGNSRMSQAALSVTSEGVRQW